VLVRVHLAARPCSRRVVKRNRDSGVEPRTSSNWIQPKKEPPASPLQPWFITTGSREFAGEGERKMLSERQSPFVEERRLSLIERLFASRLIGRVPSVWRTTNRWASNDRWTISYKTLFQTTASVLLLYLSSLNSRFHDFVTFFLPFYLRNYIGAV